MIKNLYSVFLFLFFLYSPSESNAKTHYITVASTTSTQNSGLFDKILPVFQNRSGIKVRVLALGTGQAVRVAKNGDADVLFVHHKPSELEFVAKGYGVKRFDVMYNDFIIVGPENDPAKINIVKNVSDAFFQIANSRSNFISRGDNSGTHEREKFIWHLASIKPTLVSGKWYQEVGAGMGATLNLASATDSYTLTDRGTWLSFKNYARLEILFEGDPNLLNFYGVILVNPQKYQHIRAKSGQIFIDWLVSEEGQKAIDNYKINGKQLFFSNAK
jgi:tungstate transport system substrate-binding protein